MNKRFLSTAACVLVALSVVVAALDPVSVAWKPKVGQSNSYKFNAVFHNVQGIPTGPADIKLAAKMVNTDKEIRPNGDIVVESKQSNLSLFIGDTDFTAMNPGPKEVTETSVQKPNGEVISTTSDAPDNAKAPRLDAITEFIYPDKPVMVGDTWTHERKGDKEKGTFDSVTTYKYLGTDTVNGVASYKLGIEYKETNAPTNTTANGTVWVAQSDGELVKGDLTLKDADLGQGLTAPTGELHMDRA